MCQSTNPQPELEANNDDWIDDYDTEHLAEHGPHIVRVEAHRVEHTPRGRKLFYICPLCSYEHHHGLDWQHTVIGYIERARHCDDKKTPLKNTVIQVRLPVGYKDAWDHGNIVPGRSYPPPASTHDSDDYTPRQHGPCPTGCIKDHARDNQTEEHYSVMRTNIMEPENLETSRLMVRTQQFVDNADPSDVLRWVNVQFHDLDLGTWQEVDLSIDQAEKLGAYLNFMVEGADTLESIVPAVIRYKPTSSASRQHTEGD